MCVYACVCICEAFLLGPSILFITIFLFNYTTCEWTWIILIKTNQLRFHETVHSDKRKQMSQQLTLADAIYIAMYTETCVSLRRSTPRVALYENIAIKFHSRSERCVSRFAECAESSLQWSIERTSKERRFTASSLPKQTFGQRLD